jgi:cytochrome oxidase assembly protein ShyY1
VRSVLRQRRWWAFSLFVVAMLGLCIVLANWQWSRYQQRSAENDRTDAALAAPTVPIDEIVTAGPAGTAEPPTADEQWRMVTAVGEFDPAGEVAIRRRPLDGRTGFWIVTPLRTASGVLLVNRGWAPAGRDATAAPEVVPAPPGTVTITGRLRLPETTTQRDPAPPGQGWAVDPDVLVTPASVDRYGASVELRESDPEAADGLSELPDPGHRGLNNLIYAVQWLIFAAVGAVGWWRLIRQESRREDGAADDGTATAGDADGVSADPGPTVGGSPISPDTRPAG